MRKISLAMASSLDNFIAREDDGVDWLRWSDDVTSLMEAFWNTIDTVLVGRKTYQLAVRQELDISQGLQTFVFSRTLPAEADGLVTVVSGDGVPFVRELKSGAGKDICLIGGGDFSRALFEAALIDEVNMNIHPILLGRGVPLFRPMSQQIDLKLVECRPLQEDCVSLRYRVV